MRLIENESRYDGISLLGTRNGVVMRASVVGVLDCSPLARHSLHPLSSANGFVLQILGRETSCMR